MNASPYMFDALDFCGVIFRERPMPQSRLRQQPRGIRNIITSVRPPISSYGDISIKPIELQNVQGAFSGELDKPEPDWGNILSDIRKTWGFSTSDMEKILKVPKQTAVDIERGTIDPKGIEHETLSLLKEMHDFLLEVLKKEKAIRKLLNAKIPALGMNSPKDYLLHDDASLSHILLGILKRIYK